MKQEANLLQRLVTHSWFSGLHLDVILVPAYLELAKKDLMK